MFQKEDENETCTQYGPIFIDFDRLEEMSERMSERAD
jgi:hypothetical protein